MNTVHSSRFDTDFYLGKNPAKPLNSTHVAMGDILKATGIAGLPPIPEHFGTGEDFTNDDSANPKAGSWMILGNGPDNTVFQGYQGCGDCDWASSAHVLMQAAKNSGRPIPKFSGKTVVAQYSAYSGYDPKTGKNDNGTDMQEAITWCQTKGFYDDSNTVYTFGQSVSIEPGNVQELWAATYLFEAVKIGVNLQTAQMDQFDASNSPIWDYVKGSADEGGHSIPTMSKSGLISWGFRVGYTQMFIKNQMDEGYSFLLTERYNAVAGETKENLNDADLEKYVSILLSQSNN